MTLSAAKEWAFADLKNYNCEAYAVIHYDKPSAFRAYWDGKNYDPANDYDYILFTDTDELRKFCHGQYGIDYLDQSAILHDGESITAVYSTKKLIIL